MVGGKKGNVHKKGGDIELSSKRDAVNSAESVVPGMGSEGKLHG